MSDTKEKALGVLDTLYTEQHITGEEYTALAAGIREGAAECGGASRGE